MWQKQINLKQQQQLSKRHVLKCAADQKQKELDRFLYQEKTETRKNEKQKVNLILNIVLFYKPIFFEKHCIMFTIC